MANKEAEFIERSECINCGSSNLKELSGGLFGDDPLRKVINDDPWGENPLPYIEKKKWSYVICKDCGQTFHKYVLSPEWNSKRFSDWATLEAIKKFEISADTFADHYVKAKNYVAHILRLEKMTRGLRKNKAVHILDFGCGWGEFLVICRSFGFVGYGIDRSSARRKYDGSLSIFPDIKDLKSMQGAVNSFHAVTMFWVLEHLDAPLTMLQLLRDMLVPGGILILDTPDCTGITNLKTEKECRMLHPLDHINGFTPHTMQSIAGRAGFVPINPVISHVTSDGIEIIKGEIKRLVGRALKPKTDQYFRKV